ncbi:MAG TPA: ABC transporter substrate-binding protein [Candidatus Angelobacter sp.]|nr:ABC transporter substrate-binding protein [Candidatus Angelobacter sp.]
MDVATSIKLLLLFSISFSLAGLLGALASHFPLLPQMNLARANPAPTTTWVPAGPAMDTEKASIFTGFNAELLNLITPGGGKPGTIDLTDQGLSSGLLNCLQNGVGCPAGVNPAQFSVTSPITEQGYFELQFDLSNNFWGVPFSFGNDAGCAAGSVRYSLTLSDPKASSTSGLTTACPGVSIRQGLAHLIDKNILAATATNCVGSCTPVDNPVPPNNGLPTPNACGWDTLFPSSLEVGPCEVGPVPTTGKAGGVSYHFAGAVACGVSTGCASTPMFPWEPGLGTSDFCATADHFIAAGLATGKDPNSCALIGISSSVTAHTVNIETRSTNPRTVLALGLFDAICALFTGVFRNANTAQCNGSVALPNSITSGPFVTLSSPDAVTVYHTSMTSIISNDWWIFTGAFYDVFPFDATLYGTYNSIFASNNGPNTGTFGVGDVPPCSSSSVPTSAASDYLYNCIPIYDQVSGAIEFSTCATSPNPSTAPDPTPGQANPTFANCTGGVVTGYCAVSTNPCDAVSTGYQAENLFGQQAVTIPVFTTSAQFGYLADMSNVINSVGSGIPQFYTWLNSHTTTPASSGTQLANCPTFPTIIGPDCFRQGFALGTTSLNPYDASTFWDFNIIGNIYDSLLRPNPMNSGQMMGWMTTGFPGQLALDQIPYVPCSGANLAYRFTLRTDMTWQDGAPLTSWDVEFSYLTLKATGAFQSAGLSQVVCFHVSSPHVIDIEMSSTGPFTLFGLGSPTIIPGHLWSAAGTSAWNSALSACANSSTPDSCFTTIDPSANTAGSTMTSRTFDPLANGILIGSGSYECLNPSTGVVGGGCSSTGTENPGVNGNYQLTRYGAGTTPGTVAPSSKYFRSSGTLAVYVWTGNNGQSTHDFINSSTAALCFNKPVGSVGCTQWQQGIVNPVAAPGASVGFLQVSAVTSFQGVSWTGPFNWLPGISYACCPFKANAPTGIASLPLTLYEGISTGNVGNSFSANTPQIMLPATSAGCTMAYPTGGYDC